MHDDDRAGASFSAGGAAGLRAGEASLGERFRRGDESALEEIWREHFADVCGFLNRKYRWRLAADEAEQVTIDAFERAWERRADYDPNKPSRPWLCAIADHLAANCCRSRRRRSGLLDAGTEPHKWADVRDPISCEGEDLPALVHEALGAIPAKYAELLWASVCGEKGRVSSRDLAAERGVTAATIDQWIHRGKAILKAELLRRDAEEFLRPVRKTPPTVYSLIEEPLKTENGERRTENGERRTENGERRMENQYSGAAASHRRMKIHFRLRRGGVRLPIIVGRGCTLGNLKC